MEKNNKKGKSSNKNERPSQANQIIELVTEDDEIMLFHDDRGCAYARIVIGGHKEILPCSGLKFKRWLSSQFYNLHGRVLHQGALLSALQAIEGKAIFEGKEYKLHSRIVLKEDKEIWYDLCDKDWRAIRITPEGWAILSSPPILFRRYSHQAAQVEPSMGGDVKSILQFVNISDREQEILFLVCLISFFIPGFPHPIPYIYGSQGSAKSTLSKIVRRLVDPSITEVLSIPKNSQELIQMLAHHYLLFFDNVSTIYDQTADLLCRAITGSGFSKRKLFTDDDDWIYTIILCIGINGINLGSVKPDLLERSILFELQRISKKTRKSEEELTKAFKSSKPKLLGAIFSAVSKAMKIKETITIDYSPRMADFTLWGCAIAEAIGYSKEEFLSAYMHNIGSQNEEVLNEHPEAALLIELLRDQKEWSGTASELLEVLREMSKDYGIAENELPKKANALSRKLGVLRTNLEEEGIKVVRSKGTSRTLTIIKTSTNTAEIDVSSVGIVETDNKDDIDGTPEQLSMETN